MHFSTFPSIWHIIVFKIHRRRCSLPISLSLFRSSDFLKDVVNNHCISQTRGDPDYPLSQRYLAARSMKRHSAWSGCPSLRDACSIRLADRLKKRQMHLAQILEYLGVQFNTDLGLVFLPRKKVQKVQLCTKIVMSRSSLSAKECMQYMGHLSPTIPLVPWARWLRRMFQFNFSCQ